MDAMGVKPGQRVADIGCGSGYFSFHLASRVGAEGKVYAVDIDQESLNKVRQRKEREKLGQVEPILGESADPRLPTDLDAVLIVDTYHEFREYDRMMQAVLRALKPGGRLALIDGEGPPGRPRTEYHRLHTIPAELVREEIASQGFVFKESRPGFYDAEYGKRMYFLIFEKPLPGSSPASFQGYLWARRTIAKTIRMIRPIPIIQPRIHIGHIIQAMPPIIPFIIPPPIASIMLSAMIITPATINNTVKVVLDINHSSDLHISPDASKRAPVCSHARNRKWLRPCMPSRAPFRAFAPDVRWWSQLWAALSHQFPIA
jgi:SAM-dependent methyltransferase